MWITIKLLIFGILLNSLIFSEVNSQLIDAEEYIIKVTKRFMHHLQNNQVTGNALPIADYTTTINHTVYGLDVIGELQFHSGFVNKIGMAYLRTNNLGIGVGDKTASITGQFYFEEVEIFYDVKLDLLNIRDISGQFVVKHPPMSFDLAIVHDLKTNIVTPSIGIISSSSTGMVVDFYPKLGHMQITAERIRNSPEFRQPMSDSISAWKDPLQKLFFLAVNEFTFPEICYYCPKKKESKKLKKQH